MKFKKIILSILFAGLVGSKTFAAAEAPKSVVNAGSASVEFVHPDNYIAYFLEARRLCREMVDEGSRKKALLQIEDFVNNLLSYSKEGIFPGVEYKDDDVMTRYFVAYKILCGVRSRIPGFCEKQFNMVEGFHSVLDWDLHIEKVEEKDLSMDVNFFHRIDDLIQNDRETVAIKSRRERTFLHKSAKWGDFLGVQIYLVAGSDPNAEDFFGFTPLHLAVRSYYKALESKKLNTVCDCLGVLTNYKKIIKALVLCGADINYRSKRDFVSKSSPLTLAKKLGDFGMCEFLRSLGATE